MFIRLSPYVHPSLLVSKEVVKSISTKRTSKRIINSLEAMNSQISVLSVSNSDFRIISFLTFYNPAPMQNIEHQVREQFVVIVLKKFHTTIEFRKKF